MKALFTTLAFAVLLMPFAGAAQTSATSSTTTAKKPTMHRVSGTVVSATDSSLVITTSSNKQDTFTLNSTTKKTGELTPGNKVSVSYKMSGTDMVATSVRPSTAKKSASSTTTKSGS